MGSLRSMDGLLRGFSVSFMLAAFGFGIFRCGPVGRAFRNAEAGGAVNILWLAVMVGVSLRYFFIIPVSFFAITLLIFVLAWLKLPAEGAI